MTDEKTKRTRRTKAEIAADAAEKLGADLPPPPGDPQPPDDSPVLDGVFVVKRVDPESGDLLPPQVIKNGNLGLLEVESLLKLGLKEFQDKMGFS